MEIIRGKSTSFMGASALSECLLGYENIHIDIGTGDGRFIQHVARCRPDCFAIGIDACRENLQEASRGTCKNALFVIANAQTLPSELDGLASQVTINFPWGSLLEGLLCAQSGVLNGLTRAVCPGAKLEVRLNSGALAEFGWLLEDGARQIRCNLTEVGWQIQAATPMTASDLKSCPTTWAKRLAYGRDPRGICLRAVCL